MLESRYTFEITNASYAREHALHCLSMRPDDFVQYGITSRRDAPNEVKGFIQSDKSSRIVLAYEGGNLVNNVFVEGGSSDSNINIIHAISAPQNGSLAYIYGSIYLEVLRFFADQGYNTYSTEYLVGHNAHKLLNYYSETFTEYDFDFQELSNGKVGNLVIDLVNLKVDTPLTNLISGYPLF